MNKKLLIIAAATFAFAACNTPQKEENKEVEVEKTVTTEEETEESTSMDIDVDAVCADINTYRQAIEDKLETLERVEMDTTTARAQIGQKWATIHYYFDGGELVRVKTYPHEGVSERTEEFYYQNGALICAVVEDSGMDQGKEESIDGKVYYYHEGTSIREVNNTGEKEYSIRESDAERLMQEAMEYLEMAPESAAS
jgi:hypothetical protein